MSTVAGETWGCLLEGAAAMRAVATAEVIQNRSSFTNLVKRGRLDGFDDARHVLRFKRHEQDGMVREPGPLEDEATASAVRNALASEYASLKLKLKVGCSSGNLSLSGLPDDSIRAAAILDEVLALDGVRSVKASQRISLRLP